jgi:hypothetical protein
MALRVIPLELREANSLVESLHRHHAPTVGHRFSIGAVDEFGVVHSAAIVGRPVARLAGSPRQVLEVLRLVSDGTPNACSILYAAAARAGRAMGYERIQTYILESEIGTTLTASGWNNEGVAGGGQWKHTDGKPRRTDQPTGKKARWSKTLNPNFIADIRLPSVVESQVALTLFAGAEG